MVTIANLGIGRLARLARHALCPLALAGLAALAGCAAMIEEASRGPAPAAQAGRVSLMPHASVSQGTLPPATGAVPMRLVRPIAVAARGGEVYIVDAALAAVFRVDPIGRQFERVASAGGGADVRIALGVDRSVWILVPGMRSLTRVTQGGRRQEPLRPGAGELAQPVDLAFDEVRGRMLVADALHRRLAAFAPSSTAWALLEPRGDEALRPRALSRVAAGPRHLYLADPQCACVLIAAADGTLTGRLAGPPLPEVGGMAVDEAGRLYVADAVAGEIRIYVEGRPIQSIRYATLRIDSVGDLRIGDGVLWIVDPVGARVEARRILARAAGS